MRMDIKMRIVTEVWRWWEEEVWRGRCSKWRDVSLMDIPYELYACWLELRGLECEVLLVRLYCGSYANSTYFYLMSFQLFVALIVRVEVLRCAPWRDLSTASATLARAPCWVRSAFASYAASCSIVFQVCTTTFSSTWNSFHHEDSSWAAAFSTTLASLRQATSSRSAPFQAFVSSLLAVFFSFDSFHSCFCPFSFAMSLFAFLTATAASSYDGDVKNHWLGEVYYGSWECQM